jgi:hypothetical protein
MKLHYYGVAMGRSKSWAAVLAIVSLACPAAVHAGNPTSVDKPDSTNKAEPAAPAGPAETDKADESFHAGRELLKDKRYADACPKFEESQRADPASGTLLALAYCQELCGLLASSWANYRAAAQLAEREGHADRQAAATQRAQALTERLSRLTVVVPPELLSLPGFQLTRDGVEFERASFGVPIAMDGGTHAFVASAPNRTPWASTVTLYGERDLKTLVLPILDPASPSPPQAGSAASLPLVSHADSQHARSLKVASLALGAGSIIGLGLGTVLAFTAQSKNNQSNAGGHCSSRGCDGPGTELRNDALARARGSTWSFIAAGALAAGSITLYVASSSSATSTASSKLSLASRERAARIEGNLSLSTAGVSITGRF